MRSKGMAVLAQGFVATAQPSVERQLFEEARAGSTSAREEIVKRHWDDAFRVAYLITHDRHASEDLAQEALIAALGALDNFDADRPFAPWLRRIAANKTYDWLRRRESRPEIVQADPPLAVDTDDDQLADELTSLALGEELVAALSRLEIRYRAPVVLRYLVELEPREIAELLEVEAATVRTRLHRGLKLLHADLTAARGGSDEQAG
jgi:RNA polymerase sigma factor (sigma-70 family)